MVNKLGQMKIQQMAFMLMAITLFFVFVGLFMVSIKFSDIKKSAESLEEKNALFLASQITSYPELACGTAYGTQKTNCIDTDKLIILMQNSEIYSNFWEVENLIIRKIYLESNITCTPENYPNCGVFELFKGEQISDTSSFVSLCRKESENGRQYNKCELGKIFVGF